MDVSTASSFGVSTASTASSTSTSRCCNNKGGCKCVSTSGNELNVAFERFRLYERLLLEMFIGSIVNILLAPLILYFVGGLFDIIFWLIVVIISLFAIWGCLKQKISMLYPILLLEIFFVIHFLTGSFFTIFYMFNTAYCDKLLEENSLIRLLAEKLYSLGFKWRKLLLILRLWCVIDKFRLASKISTTIKMMPTYSYELHKFALDMFSFSARLNNPTFVKHLRMHVRAQESKKSR